MFNFLRRYIRRNYGEDRVYYTMVDDIWGFIPYNIELYKLALIHKSASLVLEDGTHINNERLEYLGDAIIEAVTSDFLYIELPAHNEGSLTQLRSKIVSRQSLNRIAKAMGLDGYVISNGNGNFVQKHLLGDAFEAAIGAIYLDMGYDFVNRLLINRIYPEYINLEDLMLSETDFKSRLIEWAQKEHHTIEFITSHDSDSTSRRPLFYSKVMIAGVEVGHGVAESKKEAEQRAAQSVSEGVPDRVSDELLDRLDSYESGE
ncbi:MAG: ribonuclease III [Rikenellaceae bacterium]